MKVLVAQNCGFCLGVKNAIRLAEETLAKEKPVYSLWPIIHNNEVVEKLAKAGLRSAESVEQIPAGATVLVRSHGASLEQLKKIKEKGLNIADATCVLVKRVQKIARKLREQGYKVVVIGDKNHPEVQAVVGSARQVSVVANFCDLHNLPSHSKLGIICQTTQSPDHFAETVAELIKHGFSELKIINTLCKEAIKRQNSAVALCKQVDIMFILGGLHSANTRKLAELCKKYNNSTFHLQNWKELDKRIVSGKNVAGVTAGASTPDVIIGDFVRNLEALEPGKINRSL